LGFYFSFYFEILTVLLGSQNTGPSDSLYFFLSFARKESGLDNDGLLGESSFTQNLEDTSPGTVNDWGLLLVVGILGSGLLGHQSPELVQVDGGVVGGVDGEIGVLVEVPHTNFAEVSRMVLIEVDPVVMLSTSVSTTSGMLPVLSNPSVSMTDMATQLPGLFLTGWHLEYTTHITHKISLGTGNK